MGLNAGFHAVWPGQRVAEWTVISLLLLSFSPSVFKSSSRGCLREPKTDLHSSSQLGLPLTKKHIIFSSMHDHFSWNAHTHTHALERANRKWWINFENYGNLIWKLKYCARWVAPVPVSLGGTIALSKVLIVKLPVALNSPSFTSGQVLVVVSSSSRQQTGVNMTTSPLYTIIYNKNRYISAVMLFAVNWGTSEFSGTGSTHHLCLPVELKMPLQ